MGIRPVDPVISSFVKETSSIIKPKEINIEPDGYKVELKATSEKHFNFKPKKDNSLTFSNYIKDSIISTNESIAKSELLQEKLITDPTSVNIEEVTIAAKEAEVSLNLAKTILNKLIQGYKDLINIR
ncbi:MAG: flagellar hook-basal body complex protein FliE [Spirochaetes bacterium]|nr:flagellar hook-basal body complex protein FliE [Spirochaetota bacterium]